MRLKQGTEREDGMIFWQYSHGKERWVTAEKYKEMHAVRKAQNRLRHLKNKEKSNAASRAYRQANRDQLIQYAKDWRKRNPGKCRELQVSWRSKNRERFRTSRRQYMRRKRQSDLLFKLRCNIATLIQNGIRNMGFSKTTRTAEILGCSFEFFKAYIEQRFLPGMSWENRIDWHLDHITPISLAKTKKQVLKLNHYTNFRPLWASENQSRGNRTNQQLDLLAA